MTPEPWSSAAGWREFFDLLSDAVVVLDANACVVMANTAALRLMPCEAGTSVEQLQARLGAAAVDWLKRAAAAEGALAPPPDARLIDGRPASMEWRRLDQEHAALRLVAAPPGPAVAPAVQVLRVQPAEEMREVIAFLWDSPYPTILQGPDFRFLDVNQPFAELLGYPREQLVGRDALEFQPVEDQTRVVAARERIRAGGARAPEPAMVDGRLIDSSGRERRYRVSRRTLVDSGGKPLYLGVLQDTTAEYVARERAERSVRELDDWFDLSPVGMVLFDEGGLLLRTNPAFDALVGATPVSLGDAAADLRALLGWNDKHGLSALEPGSLPVQQQGWVVPEGTAGRLLRAVLRSYRTAGGQRRYMAIVEDRSAEEERDLAQVQIGALMDTAGVGLATFQESSGWVRQWPSVRSDAAPALQSVGRDIVLPGSLVEFERLQQALRHAERCEVRYQIDHPELGRRWLLTRVEPATLASGKRTTSVVTLDITDQQETQAQTEHLLHELGNQQRELEVLARDRELMFSLSGVGIAFLRDGRIQRANQAMAQLTGYDTEALSSLPIARLFSDDGEFEANWSRAMASLHDNGQWIGERQMRLRDGRLLWVQASKRLVVPGDLAGGIIASYVDVDSRHRAERAVALQAERTRSILDSVLVGIVTVGPHGIEWMNRSARRMFGADLIAFLNQPIATVATPEPDHPFLRTQYLTELVEGQAETFECRVRALDGREFWVVGNVVSTARESTGRQLTYALLDIERRREADARVSQAQQQLQRVIEAAPLAITLRDARTLQVLQINRVAAASVQRAPEALIGGTPEDIFDPQTAALRREDMMQALMSTEVTRREYRTENDGEVRVWDARYLPIASAPGVAADQLLFVATDVTEQRATQEARLEAAIAQREMLVQEVHHRIKNNLQGVAGLLQQIAQRKPEVAGAIAEVVGQVQAIAQVYGLQVGEGGPLQLMSVVKAIATSVQRTFGRPIRFGVTGASAPEWVLPEAESIPIALSLNELLTNAVKHSVATPEVEVSCTLDCSEDEVQLRVSNRGVLAPDFNVARIPGGVSGLGLVRALLPRRGAAITLSQRESEVLACVILKPPNVLRERGSA